MNDFYTSRPLKSKTTAILLTFFFGPIGLLYASVSASLKMIIGFPILLFLIIGFGILAEIPVLSGFTVVVLLFFLVFYWPISIIWASIAVDKYNRKIMEEEYLSQQQQINSQQLFDSNSSLQIDIPSLEEKTEFLYNEISKLKSKYDNKEIIEVEYVIKKGKLEKQIEILKHNLSVTTLASHSENEDVNEKTEKKGVSYLIIFILVALIPISLIGYQKGWFFDKYGNDKSKIKKQIEKTYFGIANGAYTSSTINGIGSDQMPFYNLNFSNVALMGLAPLANILGAKFQIEAKNIEVYNFIDDNTAKVKYNLFVYSGSDTNSIDIDMVVKKIGGSWKLDGEKFIGMKSDQSKDQNRKSKSEISIDYDNYISKEFVNNPNSTAWKIIAYREDASTLDTEFQKSDFERSLIFNGKKIFMIVDGRIDKVWNKVKEYYDDEYLVIKTKEGYTISQFGNITITDPNKYSIQYDGYSVPIKDILIEKSLIR